MDAFLNLEGGIHFVLSGILINFKNHSGQNDFACCTRINAHICSFFISSNIVFLNYGFLEVLPHYSHLKC